MTRTGPAQRFRATTAALAAVLFLLAGSTSAAADDGAPSLDAALFAKIDTFLASEREASDIPGLAVVIVAGDQIVHTGALGVADGCASRGRGSEADAEECIDRGEVPVGRSRPG